MKKFIFLFFILLTFLSLNLLADTNSFSLNTADVIGALNSSGSARAAMTNVYPLTMKNLYTTNYTVPDGYSFYITSIKHLSENDGLKIKQDITATSSATAAADSAGASPIGMDTTTWTYSVQFYSRYTQIYSVISDTYISVIVNPLTKQVNVSSIPVSSNRSVTARLLWRKSSIYDTANYHLLTTINDNSTTTYTDNTTDTLISANTYAAPVTQTAYRILSGRTNGNKYGTNPSISLINPLLCMEYDVISADNNNSVITGLLFPSSSIFVTKSKLYTTNYTVPDTNILVMTNFYMPGGADGIYIKWAQDLPSIASFAAEESTPVTGRMASGTYYYKYTFYSDTLVKESELCSDSVSVTIGTGDTGTVRLTGLATCSKSWCGSRKIYRSRVDDPNTFFYTGVVSDNSTTIYQDVINDTELGDAFLINKTMEVISQYVNYNLNNIVGDCFAGVLPVNEKNIITATSNTAVFNGYLAELK